VVDCWLKRFVRLVALFNAFIMPECFVGLGLVVMLLIDHLIFAFLFFGISLASKEVCSVWKIVVLWVTLVVQFVSS